MPFDDPGAARQTAIPLGAHAGGAGFRRIVLGKPGGFRGCRLFVKPGLFRFPQRDERGDVLRIIRGRQGVVDVVRPLHFPAPFMPLDGVQVCGRREAELQRCSVNNDQSVGRNDRYVCSHAFHPYSFLM